MKQFAAHRRYTKAILVTSVAIGLLATGCSSSQSQPSQPSASQAADAPLKFGMVQPNTGVQPVVDFLNSATKSLDISMYEFDSTYSALVDPLKAASARGVKVRILISPTSLSPTNKPVVSSDNANDVKAFNAMGFQAALASEKEFAWYHQKSVVADANTANARALIADFNFAESYFTQGASPYDPNESGTRGMAVVDSNPADVATIVRTFNEDFPPVKKWSGSDRPDLVWAPSGPTSNPKGNSIQAFTNMFKNARSTIDAYVQVFNYETTSIILQPLLDAAKRGVKIRMVTNQKALSKAGLLPQLQAAGINIVMAPQALNDSSKYIYIHTKTVIVDQGQPSQLTYVGSANPFLNDSLNEERELGVLVTDPGAVSQALEVFNRDYGAGKPYSN